MVKFKNYTCDKCKHGWVESIGVRRFFRDFFKIRRCPMCDEIIYDIKNYTNTSGPR